MNTLKKKFGQRVKELRKSLKYTQEQVAQLIDIEPPNVSKLESGLHFPQPENIEKLAKALNVEVKELFDFDHIKSRDELIDAIDKQLQELTSKELEYFHKSLINYKIIKNL